MSRNEEYDDVNSESTSQHAQVDIKMNNINYDEVASNNESHELPGVSPTDENKFENFNLNMFREHLEQATDPETELTLEKIQEINRLLNRKCSYRYCLYKKSAKYYKFRNLWLSTVPLVILGLVNAGLAITNIALSDEIILLNTFIIIFSCTHSVWKATCHWIDYAKTGEKFENLSLHMDMLALECSLNLAKFKKNAERGVEPSDLDFEKRDLINFLEKSARIDEKLSEGLKDVPKSIKNQVDHHINDIKNYAKSVHPKISQNTEHYHKHLIERDDNGNLTIVVEEEALKRVEHIIGKSELPGSIVGKVNVAAEF